MTYLTKNLQLGVPPQADLIWPESPFKLGISKITVNCMITVSTFIPNTGEYERLKLKQLECKYVQNVLPCSLSLSLSIISYSISYKPPSYF